MTIAFVRAYPLAQARDVIEHQNIQLAGELLEYPGRVFWIGFEPIGPSPARGLAHSLVLLCDDTDPKDYGPEDTVSTDPNQPTIEHARAIVSALRTLHEDPEEWAVAAHCTAGVRRSGTVAEHVWRRYRPQGLRPARYSDLHRRCLTNRRIYELLQQAEGASE